MKEYEHTYVICNQPDDEIFYKQCAALAAHIPGLKPERLLRDVNGTLIQIYHHELGELRVVSDHYEWGLYIDSDFDIEPYF